MKNTSKLIFTLFVISLFACNSIKKNKTTTKKTGLKLSYDKPALDWQSEALPIGNAFMGAMFFGGVEKEQIQFTEGTLWSGGPDSSEEYNFGNKKEAWKHIKKIRTLLDSGKMEEANEVAKRELSGTIHKKGDYISKFGDYGSQQTMGDLFVHVKHKGKASNYTRELDIGNAAGKVNYSIGNNHYSRTYFANYPSNVLVYRFESTKQTDYAVSFKTPHKKNEEIFSKSLYSFKGEVGDNGMKFETCLKVETDGEVKFLNGEIQVSNAEYLNIYHVSSTDYLNEYPTYTGNDYLNDNLKKLQKIKSKSFKELQNEHRKDYTSLFNRLSIDLGDNQRDSLTTDVRLNEYHKGVDDFGLEELYLQYARYLMISGSRKGSMPLNLQGKWNNKTQPQWACDYHLNINQQMLYWPTEVANLSECHVPLIDYIGTLVEPGKVSAKEFFNTRGWVVNTMNNPFGYTAPGWGFPWGFFPSGAGWLCQHLWEHYEFTQDKTYLKETAYPIMKESALFWVDYLIKDENGFLVSSPSYSSEHGGISRGASMDHQVAWDVLNNCIQACEVLNIDKEFKIKATQVRDKILKPTIGRWGQLQEWKEDIDDPKSTHRHVSHLYAFHPGKQISLAKTPALADAAKVSLNARGDEGTGWSLAWKINFWSRFKDGDRAYKLFRRLMYPVKNKTDNWSGGGSYSNLLCAHPPFQLDGNMGACAGMIEMLLQSHENQIELLPALPSKWKNGSVKGLKARGGFEVDMEWKNGKLIQAEIKALKDGDCKVSYKNNPLNKQMKAGEIWKLSFE